MSEPDENDDLPFERSSIAAIGARRRWRLFGKHEDPGEPIVPLASRDQPPSRGMLASLAGRSGPEPRAAPETRRSVLSLDGASTAAPEDAAEPVLAPLTATARWASSRVSKSTLLRLSRSSAVYSSPSPPICFSSCC